MTRVNKCQTVMDAVHGPVENVHLSVNAELLKVRVDTWHVLFHQHVKHRVVALHLSSTCQSTQHSQ